MRVNGFCHFFLFVTFVVLIVDQLVERGDGPFELQKQDTHVCVVMSQIFLTNLKKWVVIPNSLTAPLTIKSGRFYDARNILILEVSSVPLFRIFLVF